MSKSIFIKKIFICFLFVFLFLTGCVTPADDVINPQALSLFSSAVEGEAGTTVELKVSFIPLATTEKDLLFTSADTEIATVDENGKVELLKPGNTTITITSKAVESVKTIAYITVTTPIEKINPTGISFDADSMEYEVGDTVTLNISFTPDTTNQKEIVFTSSNTNIATIVNNKVSFIAVGTVEITATSTVDSNVKTTVTVTVIPDDPSNNNKIIDLAIYSINDFHGMVFETTSGVGISKLGKYLLDNKNENSLIISAGDMFQGSAVSSMSRGKAIVDTMNYIGFDAMTIGNHEFDWGDKEIIKFFDNDETNGEAKFPIICANITDKTTNQLVGWAKPYTTVVKNGVKIGIIGIIGQDEERDILASYVKNYDFTDELTAIKKYTKILRNDENCDVIIVSAHCDTSEINQHIANLTSEYKVDAVINGHTHQQYFGEVSRSNGAPLPYVQSGCYGRYIGKIVLTYNKETSEVTDSSAASIYAPQYCTATDSNIDAILSNYQEYIDKANEELGIAGFNIYKDTGGSWTSDVLQEKFDGDIGVVNTGGIRGNGFPIYKDSMITYGDIFEITPFENMIRTVEITGQDVIDYLFAYEDSYFLSTNCNRENQTINGVKVDPNKYYKIITIDYVFEKYDRPFLTGKNIEYIDQIFRDVLAEAVKENVSKNGVFTYYK